MPPNRNAQTLSSRDPSNKSIAVRLPPDLVAAVDAACAEQGITQSELLRTLVASWAYGESKLSGPDAGYLQGRAMAAQLAHAALRKALESLPSSPDEAHEMLQGYLGEQADRRGRRG